MGNQGAESVLERVRRDLDAILPKNANNAVIAINAGGVGVWIATTACIVMLAVNVALLFMVTGHDRKIERMQDHLNAIYMMAPHLKPPDEEKVPSRPESSSLPRRPSRIWQGTERTKTSPSRSSSKAKGRSLTCCGKRQTFSTGASDVRLPLLYRRRRRRRAVRAGAEADRADPLGQAEGVVQSPP